MQKAFDYLQSLGAKVTRSDVAGHWVVNGKILSMDEIKKLPEAREKVITAKAEA